VMESWSDGSERIEDRRSTMVTFATAQILLTTDRDHGIIALRA
jgi:hypothetical protein